MIDFALVAKLTPAQVSGLAVLSRVFAAEAAPVTMTAHDSFKGGPRLVFAARGGRVRVALDPDGALNVAAQTALCGARGVQNYAVALDDAGRVTDAQVAPSLLPMVAGAEALVGALLWAFGLQADGVREAA